MAIFNFGHQFFLSFGSHIFQSIRNLCDSALFETIEKKGGGGLSHLCCKLHSKCWQNLDNKSENLY